MTERPRLEALRTEFPSPVTEAGDARTVKNYGKIEAGLIERDACSFTVPDTRETWITLFISPISTPRSGLRHRLRLFGGLIRIVENSQDLSQANMIYDVERDDVHV